jgi:hypothetical protein
MLATTPQPKFSAFFGLNNVSDPLRLGLGWLATANNVDVTDSGAIKKRKGYTLAKSGAFTSAYSTNDFQRMYVVRAGFIETFEGAAVATLTSTATMYWAEVNNHVYYNNGVDSGVIAPDHSVSPWRGAPISEGAGFKQADGSFMEVQYDALPLDTDVIQFFGGRMYAAQYVASQDQTVVWASEPLGFHLFSLDKDFFVVPGKVLMLAPHESALVVGTDTRIYAYDGQNINQLSDYGVVPGQHWAADDQRILFWSTRGLCAAMPFTNLTEKSVSVAPGLKAGAAVVRQGGQSRYLVALQQGAAAFNPYV